MKRLTLLILLLTTLPSNLTAARIALVGGRVHTMTGAPIENGVVLIDGDRITGVGANLAVPAGFERVDVSGKSVFPGLINASTVLGLSEYGGLVPSTVDTNETTNPVTPQLRVTDAFHLDSRNIPVVRRYGVTQVLVTPGTSNVFSGQSALVALSEGLLEDVIRESSVAVHINLGEPPRSTYGPRNRMPMTRMGIAAMVRQTLIDAKQYAEKVERDPSTSPDLALAALVPLLRGEKPAIIRAQRLDDLLTALRLTEEFGLNTILTEAADAYKIAAEIAARNIPVILGQVTTQPTSMETQGAVYENAALLHKAGVLFAISTGGAQQAGQLPFEAGMAAAYGLDKAEALRSITINPARILGIDDRYGTLESGKIADVVVVDGLILQPRNRVEKVFIKGQEISLKGWQEALYEKYRNE